MSKVFAGIHMTSAEHNRTLLRALEAGIRNAPAPNAQLQRWWIELRNMRWRAFVEGWSGWDE